MKKLELRKNIFNNLTAREEKGNFHTSLARGSRPVRCSGATQVLFMDMSPFTSDHINIGIGGKKWLIINRQTR